MWLHKCLWNGLLCSIFGDWRDLVAWLNQDNYPILFRARRVLYTGEYRDCSMLVFECNDLVDV